MERFWSFWPLWLYLIFEIAVAMIFFAWLNGDLKKIWRWLKGSRVSYYLVNEEIKSVPRRIGAEERIDHLRGIPVMEIGRKRFKARGTILDFGENHFQILKVHKVNTGIGDWVYLKDQVGLPLEESLHMINLYPSLQAMLDRIAELESRPTQLELQAAKDNLFLANKQRQDWHAGTIAILRLIDGDKQRYRSQAAKSIRENLEYLRQCQWSYDESRPSDEIISMWLDKLSKPEAKVVR